jgi:hypothetical protein
LPVRNGCAATSPARTDRSRLVCRPFRLPSSDQCSHDQSHHTGEGRCPW